METEKKEKRNRGGGKALGGLIVVALGVALLLKQMNIVIFPYWLFTWPVFMLALGLFIGVRRGFCGGAWLMLMLVGGVFLYKEVYPGAQVSEYIWPIIIIAAGLMMIFRHKRHDRWYGKYYGKWGKADWYSNPDSPSSTDGGAPSGDDFIDSTSVFGGVHKVIVSKKFRGGDIVNIFGGADINLTQADFTGTVTLEVTQIFGGTKIIIPPDWKIQTKMTSVFGGVEDKRPPAMIKENPEKTLIIDGTSIFAGISIQCY